MNCPVCIGPILDYRFLEFKIPGYRCHKCDGTWLMANEYVQWLYSQNPPSGTGQWRLKPFRPGIFQRSKPAQLWAAVDAL